MSESPKGSSAPRERRAAPWIDTFLAKLAETSNVAGSARTAKVDTGTAYRLKREDAAFRARWQQALCEGYDALEMDLLRRLREGELEAPKAGGKRRARKYDNATAFRILEAHRTAVAKARAEAEMRDEDAVYAAIDAKLDAMREREKALKETLARDGTFVTGGSTADDDAG